MRLLPISWPLLLAALALSLLIAGGFYAFDTVRKRRLKQQRAQLVAAGPGRDTIALQPIRSATLSPAAPPLLLIVAIGTFGMLRALATLRLLAMNGLAHLVGGGLIVENDAGMLAIFKRELPLVFRDGRIVCSDNPGYSGFSNQPIDWVLKHAEEWATPIQEAAREAFDTYLHNSGNIAPELVVTFLSLGGQGPAAIPVHAELAEHFGDTTLKVVAAGLPKHERLRERFDVLKPRLDAYGVAGWPIIDSLEPGVTTADNALAMLLVGQFAAASTAEAPTAANNMFALVCSKHRGSVLVFQTVRVTLPAFVFQPDQAQPPTYYVQRRPLIVRVQRALRRLEGGNGIWSADLPVPERGTSTFDLVVLNVTPAALRTVQDAVLAGRTLQQQLVGLNGRHATSLKGGLNRELALASLATPLDPLRPTCQVIAIRLQAVRDGARLVPEIVKAPSQRRLPAARLLLKGQRRARAEYIPADEETLS